MFYPLFFLGVLLNHFYYGRGWWPSIGVAILSAFVGYAILLIATLLIGIFSGKREQ